MRSLREDLGDCMDGLRRVGQRIVYRDGVPEFSAAATCSFYLRQLLWSRFRVVSWNFGGLEDEG